MRGQHQQAMALDCINRPWHKSGLHKRKGSTIGVGEKQIGNADIECSVICYIVPQQPIAILSPHSHKDAPC